VLLDGGGPKGRDRAAISCRKSEIKLSSPHEQSILSACRIVGPPFRRLFRDDTSARKKRILKISHNPLISLDSDEKIQGNPRKSNPQNLGFLQRNGRSPRKPKSGSTTASRPLSRRSQTTPSQCTAVSTLGKMTAFAGGHNRRRLMTRRGDQSSRLSKCDAAIHIGPSPASA
jgi:hypothetical protein